MFEVTFRQGIGLDIQYIEDEMEPILVYDEDETEEQGILVFTGVRLLLPFVQIRMGEADIHVKE